jgi:predicted nucleotidyltransferase
LQPQGKDIYMGPKEDQGQLSALSREIILSLLYFDIFSYPLKAKELSCHSSLKGLSEYTLNRELEELNRKGFIECFKDCFFLDGKKEIVERRLIGNKKAMEYIQKAQKISKFISAFPFVRGIFLSGSVAKGYADKNSDIDYFIVTAPGRLWLSRTLLILYKKIFLLNSKKYFCLNYFIDTEHLEIPDKNIFTAIELSYLLPTYNEELSQRIIENNSWVNEYLPNFEKSTTSIIPTKNNFLKRNVEKLLSGFFGNKLDDFCMSMTEKFWKRKYRKTHGLDSVNIRCKKYVSKFHPQGFQDKVLRSYEEKIISYEQTYKIELRA